MKKYLKIFGLLIVIIIGIIVLTIITEGQEIKSIRSERQLHSFYELDDYQELSIFKKLLLLPFSIIDYNHNPVVYDDWGGTRRYYDGVKNTADTDVVEEAEAKDYSKTNTQVEGVDEADIIKTDGDYIYSISKKDVVITNVKNPLSVEVESVISSTDSSIPMDLILNNNKLIVISSLGDNYYDQDTIVYIYDISDKKGPKELKRIQLYEPYYTTRSIDNKLYIFSKGRLREDGDKVLRDYRVDDTKHQIDIHDIKYLKDYSSDIQTLICTVDLDNIDKSINIESYLMDISNAYVSEKAIYLLDYEYYNRKSYSLLDLFGLKGVFGLIDLDDSDDTDYNNTNIFKFKIDKDKGVKYQAKSKVKGKTVNQYSLDENKGHLRVALESEDGTRIVIFNEDMRKIGESISVAKGERMYASRFMNNKAYFVTFKNTDPLFVIDLSNEKKPKFMGKLHIPGYSTYLHPYDDTHLIGIGVDTKENISRDDNGRVISNWTSTNGMKMSLFDVSDISNPKEISKTTIGDRLVRSAILTNPKALLFSKKKKLLAIPVNRYDEDDVVIEDGGEQIEDADDNDDNLYTAEGYFVYNIDLDNGFKLRGVINHDKNKSNYYYYNSSKLLRGVYIDNYLFTVSESAVKVHDLESLNEISVLKLEENGVGNYEE